MLCKICGQPGNFPISNNFLCGEAEVCFSCIDEMFDRMDLETVDKFCQNLNVGFDFAEWIKMEKEYGPDVWEEYLTKYTFQYGTDVKWSDLNKIWLDQRKFMEHVEKIDAIKEPLYRRLTEEWGEGYNLAELIEAEDTYTSTVKQQSIVEPIRKDIVRKVVMLSIKMNKILRDGVDMDRETSNIFSTLNQSYNQILKESGLSAPTVSNTKEITDLGSLVAELERRGFTPNYYKKANSDIVDISINDMKNYLKNLVMDNPNIRQEVAARSEESK